MDSRFHGNDTINGLIAAMLTHRPPTSDQGPPTTDHRLLILLAVSLLLLSASARAADDRISITYWRPTYDVERDATVRMIRDFEAQYPHIRINMVSTSSYEEKIKTALAGGVGPDIMAVDGPLIAFYAYQGALIPLDRYYTPESRVDLIPASLEEITWNGHLWTGPQNNSSIAVYYNQGMFERAGVVPPPTIQQAWTWDRFATEVKRVMRANRVGAWQPWGLMFGIGINEFLAYAEMPWLWQAGGQVMRPAGLRASGYLDSPASVRGLTMFPDLFRTHRVASVEEITEGFVTGKAATVIFGPWSIPFYKEVYPDFTYGIMPLPRDVRQVTPCGSWHMAITSQSKHPDEAWLFIEWMTGVEGAKRWYASTRNLPARQSTYDAFPDLAAYPMRIFADQVRFTAKPRPVTPAYPIVTDAVAQAFQNAAYGQPAAEVLAKAARRIDEEIAYERMAEEGRPGKVTFMPLFLVVRTLGWIDRYAALVVINSPEKQVIQVGIANFTTTYGTYWGRILAASVLTSAPVIGLFLALQRYYVRGIVLSGMKG